MICHSNNILSLKKLLNPVGKLFLTSTRPTIIALYLLSKTEIKYKAKDLKNLKKKKRYWLLILSAIIIIVAILTIYLLSYKPADFTNPQPIVTKEVSPYLTHVLSPRFYNGIQLGDPFDLPITQKGINDIIARSDWPKTADIAKFLTPKVFFTPDSITLMGTVILNHMELVVTISGKPYLDEDGLLHLPVTAVKVGALNVTFIAKIIAETMYAKRIAAGNIDNEQLTPRIAAAILNSRPFDPTFEVNAKKARAKKITITKELIIISLAPVKD